MTTPLPDTTLTALRTAWPDTPVDELTQAAELVAQTFGICQCDLLGPVLILGAVLARGEEFSDDAAATQLIQDEALLSRLLEHSDLRRWWDEATSMQGQDADHLTLLQASTTYMTAEVCGALETHLGVGRPTAAQ